MPPPAPAEVQVKDANGASIAELRALRPCRASIAGDELIVGGPPLIATHGAAKWTGESQTNGIVLSRDGERIARVFPIGDAKTGGVFDMHGVALARVVVVGDVATVTNSATLPIRHLTRDAKSILSDDPKLTITGTDDLVLAALLTAPELVPEVRMLAACERVLAKGS